MNARAILEDVLSLDPQGSVRLDPRPKAPQSIWTYQRRGEQGEAQPYRRVRTLPNGKPLVMYIAHRKHQASVELLSKVKMYGPEVATAAGEAADFLVPALKAEGVTTVTHMPSAKPLAARFARLIANRLGVPIGWTKIEKSGRMRTVPIALRAKLAQERFKVYGKLRGQVIAVVDDYVVTASSQMAVAEKLYDAGAKKVIGVALAI